MSRSFSGVWVRAWSGLDVGDLDLGVLLAVALALLVAGLVLVLLDHDLGTLGGTEHLDRDAGLVEPGGGDRVTVDRHHDRKGERLADGDVGLVDLDDVAHGNLLLLAACAHDRVHRGLLRRVKVWMKLSGLPDRERGTAYRRRRATGQRARRLEGER